MAASGRYRFSSQNTYSYGCERFEVFSGLTNGLYIAFLAAFRLLEAAHLLVEPDEQQQQQQQHNLLTLLSIAAGLVGLVLMRRHSRLPADQPLTNSTANAPRVCSAHSFNMHGVFLHVLSDAITAVGVAGAGLLSHYRGWASAPASALCITALFMLKSCTPLLLRCSTVLLQAAPDNIQPALDRCVREVTYFDGVLECSRTHFWQHVPGYVVGSLHVRVRTDAEEQVVLTFIRETLSPYVQDLTVQVEKDHPISVREVETAR
eukprot:CAMPEP_0175165852 /NCGR_PEP_ID=MMETSP0087-20121206/27342_1 /TAXON_ID=136419 /ORGANISM="Unknown Unknown, Strain D1" /LENGTH=261 /DNA_ID=CAMNT_0016455327 /DNA_START=302 /DNA_END=1087 /DNA_ORIENTATION=-